MEGFPLAPIRIVDFIGSAVMIVLSVACLRYALLLRRASPANVLWTYLFALSLALTAFSVSRAVGHIANRLLLLAGHRDLWNKLLPYSGAVNTITFVVVGSITLFFQRVQIINRRIINDQKELEKVSGEVMRLNRDLQSLVERRTRELSASEDRYRAVFTGSMDMIFILDANGVFTDMNQAGLSNLGRESPEELVGVTSFREVFAAEVDHDRLMEELHASGFLRDRECLLRSSNGDDVLMLLSMSVTETESGGERRYHGIGKDITSRRRMERQLHRADRLASLGQISAGIAHEINNPLGVILGFTQLIMRSENKAGQNYADLKTIERQAQNCKAIVEDLLKFARATDTRKTYVDLNQCLHEMVSLLSHHFELDEIALEADLHPHLPQVMGDTEKIKQVFMNLLVNAGQAISEQGSVRIETVPDLDRGQVRISISDTGCGIPPELTDKIFDPFFTTKPVGDGTGLGLSVSYGIIRDHGGTIDVKSEVGKGTVFTVTLPADIDRSAKQAAPY
jgi:PAS domain S-box-containing protein